MKKKHFILFVLTMMLSCSSTDELTDNSPVVSDDDQTTPPITSNVKLPKEINYLFSNNFDNEIYKSDNFYTYDSLNRITKISIKSFFNDEANIDYDYKIIYNDTTSFAKGFVISVNDYQNNIQTNKFVKLKYVDNVDESSLDYAYYSYVNSEVEINNTEFVFDESKKVTGKFNLEKYIFFPNNCGSSLFDNSIVNSQIYYYRDSYADVTFMGNSSQTVNQVIKGRRFISYYPSNAPLISPFVDVKFDRVFWTFFLTDQIFQYETGFESKNVTLYDHPDLGDNLRIIIMKHNQETSTYLDGTYPTFKSYSGKYMGQDSNAESSYEYSVSYY